MRRDATSIIQLLLDLKLHIKVLTANSFSVFRNGIKLRQVRHLHEDDVTNSQALILASNSVHTLTH